MLKKKEKKKKKRRKKKRLVLKRKEKRRLVRQYKEKKEVSTEGNEVWVQLAAVLCLPLDVIIIAGVSSLVCRLIIHSLSWKPR